MVSTYNWVVSGGVFRHWEFRYIFTDSFNMSESEAKDFVVAV